MNLRSYMSSFALGHKAIEELWFDPVVVQEKIDGSQISFGLVPYTEDGPENSGQLQARSKRKELPIWHIGTGGMFEEGLEFIREIAPVLTTGYTYRGEYLQRPRQNVLIYDRVPKGHIILFDVDRGHHDYLNPEQLREEAERIGMEVVPTWRVMDRPSMDQVRKWANEESCLGGPAREGIVFKNYHRFGPDKKPLLGKYVRQEFKEKHSKAYKAEGQKQFLLDLAEEYRTEARWQKAVQHLTESGELEGEMRDIPLLIREISQDVYEDSAEEIKERLFKWAWKKLISRHITRGMPEWYREHLAREQFDD